MTERISPAEDDYLRHMVPVVMDRALMTLPDRPGVANAAAKHYFSGTDRRELSFHDDSLWYSVSFEKKRKRSSTVRTLKMTIDKGDDPLGAGPGPSIITLRTVTDRSGRLKDYDVVVVDNVLMKYTANTARALEIASGCFGVRDFATAQNLS